MFGYVRPEKPDLLMRDFAVYKSIYCGLCKAIGRRCGQIPRAAVTYDMTFFSLLLLALSPEALAIGEEGCVLNPVKKKPVMVSNPILEYAADLSCLLAWYSARDDAADDRPIRGREMTLLFSRSARKVIRRRSALNERIRLELERLNQAEQGDSIERTAACFGSLLKYVLQEGYTLLPDSEDDGVSVLLLGDAAEALGRWVYLRDAVDDRERDLAKGNRNHLLAMDPGEARLLAEALLVEAEAIIDRNLALVDYERWGGRVYNLVTAGLPATRQRAMAGELLPAL